MCGRGVPGRLPPPCPASPRDSSDNPNGPNQSQSAEKANLSEARCDGVLLDRTAPQVSIASTTSAKVGDLVAFDAQASDAGAGLGAGYEWTYGDNTAGGSGESVRHTFTQPGTYEVRVKTTDAAGNAGSATKVVVVSAPATGGGGNPGGGGSTGGGDAGDDGSGYDDAPAESGTFKVLVPLRVKLARAKAVPIVLTTKAAGRASFALVRSGRVIARGSKAVAGGRTSYRLKLPRKAKAGGHALKVTFTPARGQAKTWTGKVALVGKARRATASASGRPAPRVSAAGAPVALPDGKFHGVRTRSFVPRVR